jgi:hypothetical protein
MQFTTHVFIFFFKMKYIHSNTYSYKIRTLVYHSESHHNTSFIHILKKHAYGVEESYALRNKQKVTV